MLPENRYVIRGFALKKIILAAFALPQWRHGVALTLSILFGIASLIDVGLNFFARTPLRYTKLTYWDEAAAFALMSGIAVVIATR